MFCSNCGKGIEDNSKHCPFCGYQFGEKRDETVRVNQGAVPPVNVQPRPVNPVPPVQPRPANQVPPVQPRRNPSAPPQKGGKNKNILLIVLLSLLVVAVLVTSGLLVYDNISSKVADKKEEKKEDKKVTEDSKIKEGTVVDSGWVKSYTLDLKVGSMYTVYHSKGIIQAYGYSKGILCFPMVSNDGDAIKIKLNEEKRTATLSREDGEDLRLQIIESNIQ
ncbi:hypothetical protein M2454_000361 [Aequitasia blattaphilus]|uniref:Zinc ribbon domain-containing protein n=1 Tax=Aequitasia blattaphilus TaxID=2949332 RepID=A0ABT1E5Y1_9FIRM|nr:zinc ribbon domain-containing protein [Aequitasia blattaphilus]MCP1101247.1 zinc ribbon domain-containing protein [Aequitasia blattaphilus]MCR8613887.1 zinc ribbon domain-containing protein [Aequitasia blattaphilus]